MRQDDLSAASVRGYTYDLLSFARWLEKTLGAPLRLEKLAALDVINYRQHLVTVERAKPATVNRRLEALRRLCRWAQSQGLARSDVTAEVKAVRVERRTQPAGLTEPEVHALLRAAGESRHGLAKRNYALMQLMLQTGLRVGEVASLLRSDVLLRERMGLVRIRQGKGRKEREVPLNATARRALRAYLDGRGPGEDAEPLFGSKRASALSLRQIQGVVAKLAQRAKIARVPVSAHTLRHTFALSFLKDNPGKLVELAQLLGHDSLDTTAIYTRTSTEALAEDLEKSRFNLDG